jgi:hypothetical protein
MILFSLRNMTFVLSMTYLDNVLEAQVIILHTFFAVHPLLAMTSTFVFMKFEFSTQSTLFDRSVCLTVNMFYGPMNGN